MYDPKIGRFLEEDPKGFDAADANLYRYGDNSPTNHTDPSGLDWRTPPPVIDPRLRERLDQLRRQDVSELQNQPIGDRYRAGVNFCGGTRDQRQIVRGRLLEAATQVDRALEALERHWPQIQNRNYGVPVNILYDNNNRQFYIERLRALASRLRSNRFVHIQIEETQVNDALGYVIWPIGYAIHLNPSYFHGILNPNDNTHRADEIETLIHELGRLVGITGNPGPPLSSNNPYNWDIIIRILARDLDSFRQQERECTEGLELWDNAG